MTLLIRRRALLLFVSVVAVAVLGLAAYEYRAVSAVAAGSFGAKVVAEQILFISILTSGAVLALGILVIVRSITLSAILDKLVSMNRMTGFSPEMALNRLGEVGQKIATLYRQTAELSTKKSIKIAGISALVDYLMSVSEVAVIVSDSAGKVAYASKALLDRLEKLRAEIVGTDLRVLLPSANIDDAIKSFRRSRDPFVASEALQLDPIFSSDGIAHYVVVKLSRSVADEMRRSLQGDDLSARPEAAKTPLRSMLPRLFGRRGQR